MWHSQRPLDICLHVGVQTLPQSTPHREDGLSFRKSPKSSRCRESKNRDKGPGPTGSTAHGATLTTHSVPVPEGTQMHLQLGLQSHRGWGEVEQGSQEQRLAVSPTAEWSLEEGRAGLVTHACVCCGLCGWGGPGQMDLGLVQGPSDRHPAQGRPPSAFLSSAQQPGPPSCLLRLAPPPTSPSMLLEGCGCRHISSPVAALVNASHCQTL